MKKLISMILNSFLFDSYMDSHVRISEKGRQILNNPSLARNIIRQLSLFKTKNKKMNNEEQKVIKFRAWDRVEKILCPVKVINFDKGAFLVGNSPTDEDVTEGHFVNFENIYLMQYTGLKDKKRTVEFPDGQPIYEGDIVNYAVKRKICPDCAAKDVNSELSYGISKFCPECGKVLSDIDFITTSKVVFDKGGFAYEWSSKESYYQSWQTHTAAIYLVWVEVKGNIHEHQNLLNEK